MASGTEKRQRPHTLTIRLSAAEREELDRRASESGLAAAAFMRAAALGDAGPRVRRRPPANHAILRQVLGELGRVGNNINQIAYKLNTRQPIKLPELREALGAYLEIRNAIFEALGMSAEPASPTPLVIEHDHQGKQSRRP